MAPRRIKSKAKGIPSPDKPHPSLDALEAIRRKLKYASFIVTPTVIEELGEIC